MNWSIYILNLENLKEKRIFFLGGAPKKKKTFNIHIWYIPGSHLQEFVQEEPNDQIILIGFDRIGTTIVWPMTKC
jgi:hypothetical protein